MVLRCRVSGAFGRSDRGIAARLTRSADGAVDVVTVDAAPVLGIELCLPGPGSRVASLGGNVEIAASERKCPLAIIAMSALHCRRPLTLFRSRPLIPQE